MPSNPIRDLAGYKKGKLTAISFVKRENHRDFWLFKCDCGTTIIKESRRVTYSKGIRSCGCLNKEWLQKLAVLQRLPNNQVCKNRIFRMYKKQAKNRNFAFNLSKKQFESYLDKKCYYCGEGPSNFMREGGSSLKYNGIDRKINTQGYSMKNCVTCCYKCNKMKMNLDDKDFLDQIQKIFQWRK